MSPFRRLCHVFLCAGPVVIGGLAAVRPLRGMGVHQPMGILLFALVCVAAWVVGARAIRGGVEAGRRLAVAGVLLLVPFGLMALLWVGLGTPWEATPIENRMRYLVLLAGAMAVAGGFVVLKESLSDAGERLYSMLGLAANIFAGTAYLVWLSVQIGAYVVKVRDGQIPAAIVSFSNLLDILLFVACVLTYLATAAFAAAMGRVRWLGRGAARAFVLANLVAVFFIILRGLSFPDPTADSTPWYLRPGFIAGIPAVPWIMPFLLGVILLRRAGEGAKP